MSANSQPWWFHFAALGHSVGTGIAVFAGVAQLVPIPVVSTLAGVVAGVSTVVTHYADKGLAVANPAPSPAPISTNMNQLLVSLLQGVLPLIEKEVEASGPAIVSWLSSELQSILAKNVK